MEKDLLEIGETSLFKEPKGFIVYEFTRLGRKEKYMSDNVEYRRYDSRKKDKGKSAWILIGNLPEWYKMLEQRGFVRV